MRILRSALRPLLHRPAPTAIIVGTLAVAIGVATVTYSVIDVLWHALPVTDDGRIVFVASTDPRPSQSQAGVADGLARTGVSIPDLADFRARTRTIDAFAGWTFGTATLTGSAEPERLHSVRTTTNLLSAWRLAPAAGRGFAPRDGQPGGAPVILVSERFWSERFGRSPAAIGRALTIDGRPRTIIGVLPEAMNRGIFVGTDVALPIDVDPLAAPRDERRLFLTGILRPGVTIEQAGADLTGIAAQLRREHPRTNADTGVVVRPLIEMLGPTISTLIVFLVIIAVALVAIACANVANIVLAVAGSRRQEHAIRRSLGASRVTQVAQLVTEGLLLSAMACPIGILLAWTGAKSLLALDTGQSTILSALALNPRIFFAAVTLSLGATIAFTMLPAFKLVGDSTADLQAQSRGASPPPARRRVSYVLVSLQVGIAVMLLVQITSLGRTGWSFVNAARGFDERGVLTFRLDVASSRYANDDAVGRFAGDVVGHVASLGGIESAAVINRMPIGDRELGARMTLEGTTPLPQNQLAVTVAAVTVDYFRVMRIPIARGRTLSTDDVDRRHPVALVSQTAARRYWPGGDPIGHRVTVDALGDEPVEIIGIAGDVRNSDVDQGPAAQVYVPFTRLASRQMAVVVRTSSADPTRPAAAIRRELARLDNTQAVFDMRSMSDVLFEDVAGSIMLALVLGTIGFVALCLAAAGVYGLVSYAVHQRRREIGIRMAVGAAPGAVVRFVLMHGVRPVTVGAAVGAVGAIFLGVMASAALSEVDFRDPLNYVGVLVAVVTIAILSSYLPARRAAHVDPVITLRAE
jgi:predicted permease